MSINTSVQIATSKRCGKSPDVSRNKLRSLSSTTILRRSYTTGQYVIQSSLHIRFAMHATYRLFSKTSINMSILDHESRFCNGFISGSALSPSHHSVSGPHPRFLTIGFNTLIRLPMLPGMKVSRFSEI